MRIAEKEILRDVLGRMAEEAPEPVAFEELHTVTADPERVRKGPRLMRRPVWVAVVAAAVVLVVGAGVNLLTNTDGRDIPLAEGETLISTEPTIIQGSQSPHPSFDPAELGVEVPITPTTDVQSIVDLATTLQTDDLGEVLNITALGETPEGVLALIVHTDGEHSRCLVTTLGGAQTCRDLPAAPEMGANYTVGEAPTESSLTWDVEPETSVVTLTVNGETEWQRPVADVAVFATSLVYGDDVELTALGAEGNILASISLGTRHPDE